MKYLVFTNDVGARRTGFSCLKLIEAPDDTTARERGVALAAVFAPVKVVVVPANRSDLWTGETDPGGFKFRPHVFDKYGATVPR